MKGKTLTNAGTMLAVAAMIGHDVGIAVHPDESQKPDCVMMAKPCYYEHAGKPQAPWPTGRLRVEITSTSTTPTLSSTSFAKWL